jgi:hypothetical protein
MNYNVLFKFYKYIQGLSQLAPLAVLKRTTFIAIYKIIIITKSKNKKIKIRAYAQKVHHSFVSIIAPFLKGSIYS